jgi:alkylation response protein AidB-like acyl-CoA dehydrogenase
MAEAVALHDLRSEISGWLEENCPATMRRPGQILSGGEKEPIENPDSRVWLERCAERGYTVANWPREYGGAGFSMDEFLVLMQEMRRINARIPLGGMGVSMIGPTLLEYGTEEQKRTHLTRIANGEVRWCQGYSEPGSGSDLASLQTRAVDEGDHFVVNGSKIWTTLAHYGDWMFCLVRTDPQAPKHEGISFVLFPMDQVGVTVEPIKLLSGDSPFCQCFFDDVIAKKDDLIGELNQGWTVGKRLLQHERSGITSLAGAEDYYAPTERPISVLAKDYVGEKNGNIGDTELRDDVVRLAMNTRAFLLAQRRAVEEARGGNTPGAATSLFKLYGADLDKESRELRLRILGHQALGWEGHGFTSEEITATRGWLGSKASSIAGGTNEVQLNIIAKRVLGLPD